MYLPLKHIFTKAPTGKLPVLSGEKDDGILKSIQSICERWGGEFRTRYEKNWNSFLEKHKKGGWEIVHLTMYGLQFQKELPKLQSSLKNKIVIVGSEKVPPEVYQMADYNLSVTTQPHSEAAALGVFLHDFFHAPDTVTRFGQDNEGQIMVGTGDCVNEADGGGGPEKHIKFSGH